MKSYSPNVTQKKILFKTFACSEYLQRVYCQDAKVFNKNFACVTLCEYRGSPDDMNFAPPGNCTNAKIVLSGD